jgi:hypothetical protein
MIIEKEFPKTFDTTKSEFVILKGKTDLEMLERLRYLQSQIDLLKSNILNLSKMLKDGTFSLGAEEVETIITDAEKNIQKINFRADLFNMKLQDIEKQVNRNIVVLKNTANPVLVKENIKKIGKLESVYSELSGQNSKDLFLNLVETVDILVHRTKNLEIAYSTIQDLKLGKKVNKFKSDLENIDEKDIKIKSFE